MTTIKQKLCSKIGISMDSLKSNNLFSPSQSQQNKSIVIDNSKISKGEKAIKYFSSANEKVKPNVFGSSTYQNYKIDILVPNSEPPKPLITLENSKSYYTRIKKANENTHHMSPLKDSSSSFNKRTSNLANQNVSLLSDLNSNLMLNNHDIYSPLKKAQAKNDDYLSGNFFIFFFINIIKILYSSKSIT